VGDAALLFDPRRPEEIASCVEQLWQDETLRTSLIERGRRRVEERSWSLVAEEFRALYRSLATAAPG
jgi:glycosyltransferase involved in cell wall biosynthesis